MMRSYFRTSSSGAQARRVYILYTVYTAQYCKWISWRRWREDRPGRMTYCIYCTVHVKPWSASCSESWLPVDPRKVRSLLIEMTRTHPFVYNWNKIKRNPQLHPDQPDTRDVSNYGYPWILYSRSSTVWMFPFAELSSLLWWRISMWSFIVIICLKLLELADVAFFAKSAVFAVCVDVNHGHWLSHMMQQKGMHLRLTPTYRDFYTESTKVRISIQIPICLLRRVLGVLNFFAMVFTFLTAPLGVISVWS